MCLVTLFDGSGRRIAESMGRTKGSKNKNSPVPHTISMTTQERIEFLANVIVDAIQEDLRNGQPLLKKIKAEETKS